MFCKNCGAETKPGAKFCDVCGTKLELQEAPKAEEPAAQAPEVNIPDPNNSTVTSPDPDIAVAGVPDPEAPEANTAKKASKASLFIKLGAIAAVIAVVAIAFPYIKNFCAKAFMPAESYYRSVEENSIEAEVSKAADYIDELKKNAKDAEGSSVLAAYENKKVDTELTLTIGDSIINMLSESAGVNADLFKKIGLGIGFAMKDDMIGADLSLELNGKNIISGDAVLDIDKSAAYVTVPALTDTAMEFDIKALVGMSIEDMLSSDEMEESMEMVYNAIEAIPDGKTFEKILMRYAELALAEFDDVEKDSDEISAGSIDANCTALTVTIDDKALESAVKALLKEAKNDDELWDIIEDVVKAIDRSSAEQIGELRDQLDDNYSEIVGSLDGAFEDFGEMEYTTYVDSKGKIIGREIEYQGATIKLYTLSKGNDRGIEISLEQDNSTAFEIVGEGKVSGGNFNGEFEIGVAGQSVATLAVTDFDTEEYLKGKFVLEPSKAVSSMLPMIASEIEDEIGVSLDELGISLDSIKLEIEYNATKKKDEISSMNMGFDLIIDSKSLFAVSVSSALSEAGKIKTPSNTVVVSDEDDMEEWAENLDILGFIDSLPAEITDIITDAMNGGFGYSQESVSAPAYDYDYDYGFDQSYNWDTQEEKVMDDYYYNDYYYSDRHTEDYFEDYGY